MKQSLRFCSFFFFMVSAVLTTSMIADDSSVSTTTKITSTTKATHHDTGDIAGSITTETTNSDKSSVLRIDTVDGKTITTVTKQDTSSVKTIDNTDGSSIQTVNKLDGTSVKYDLHIDGFWSVTTTPKGGIPVTIDSKSNSESDSKSSSKDGSKTGAGGVSSSPTPDPTASPSPDKLPPAAPFVQLKVPFEIKLIPVYDNKDEKGKVGNHFFYLSESCITGNMYCAFLNSVATTGDPDRLYCSDMDKIPDGEIDATTKIRNPSPNVALIKKITNSNGTFSYSLVDPDVEVKIEAQGRAYMVHRGDLPITRINLLMAASFCNWMHNGQRVAPEGLGNTRDGAYALDNGYDKWFSTQSLSDHDRYLSLLTGIIEQPGALWVIPNIGSYVGYDLAQDQSTIHHSGLYENYGMFYSQSEIWEWTSTRVRPATSSDNSYHRDHNLTGYYYQINGVSQKTREKYAVQYQTDKVPKRTGDNPSPADPPPTNEDGFTSFRLMKVINPTH
ncbi:MAG: hypothetical protein ACOYK6_03265 [Chthoniobacterales bacterium]